MFPSFDASVVVAASAAEVWAVLADLAAWPEWDSGITVVKGRLEPGAKLRLTAGALGDGYPFRVTEVVVGERIVLTGRAPLGMFTGVRTYTLAEAAGSTTVTLHEEYAGRVAKLIVPGMPRLGASFEQFAEGLKRRVEAAGSGGA